MTAYISHTSVDCGIAYELSQWWKQLLDYTDLPDDPTEPGHEERLILDPVTGHRVLFIEVPEAKQAKNRLHFDLRPRERSRDEEVADVLAQGASVVADHRGIADPGTGWVVLADPEGDEFCLLRSDADVARQPR